jgi:hypothetical protein
MAPFPSGATRALTPIALNLTSPAQLVFSQPAPTYANSYSYAAAFAPPPGGYAVAITFRSFLTEPGYDYVTVYAEATLSGATLLGRMAGQYPPGRLPTSLQTPLQAPPASTPSVLLTTDSSNVYSGIVFLASLVCAAPACAGAALQPSTSPIPTASPSASFTFLMDPTASSTPTSRLMGGGGGGGGMPGLSPGAGGGGSGGSFLGGSASGSGSGSGSDNPAAAGVAVSVLLLAALGGGVGFCLFRHHAAQQLSKLSSGEGPPLPQQQQQFSMGSGFRDFPQSSATVVNANPMVAALQGLPARRGMGAGV